MFPVTRPTLFLNANPNFLLKVLHNIIMAEHVHVGKLSYEITSRSDTFHKKSSKIKIGSIFSLYHIVNVILIDSMFQCTTCKTQ